MAKIKYKKVRKLIPSEAGYIAGIIDGEGTVTLSHRNRGEQRRIEVAVYNTDFNLLSHLLQIIGAGRITRKNPSSPKYRMAYVYSICSQQALDLLAQIVPYLRTYKQNRANLVLENYKKLTPRNGKYSEEILRGREKFVKTFFATTQRVT